METKYWCDFCDMDRFPTEVLRDESHPLSRPRCIKCNLIMSFFTINPENQLKFMSFRSKKTESKIKRFFKKLWKNTKRGVKHAI